jgi:hypothetical protein
MSRAAKQAERRRRRATIKDRKRRIAELKKEIGRLQRRRDSTLKKVRQQCERARSRTRSRVAAIEREEMAALRARIRALRTAARERCQLRRERAASAYKSDKARRRAEIRAKEKEIEELRAANAASLSAGELRRRLRARELAQEREEFVLQDIPEELHGIYRRVRAKLGGAIRDAQGRIKASKAERFAQWVEEHPEEVLAITQRQAERDLQKLLQAREREERALHDYQLRQLRKLDLSKREAEQLIAMGLAPPPQPQAAPAPAPF